MSWDEDYADEEWVDDEDNDDVDDILLCPNCREDVHEDTQQCPHCGDWITPVYPGEETKQWIWKVVVLLILLSFLIMIAF